MRLSIENDGMDLGARTTVVFSDRRACADETTARCGHVDHRLALLWIIRGLLQIQFPDPEKWFALFILRHQNGRKREHRNEHTKGFPEHFSSLIGHYMGCGLSSLRNLRRLHYPESFLSGAARPERSCIGEPFAHRIARPGRAARLAGVRFDRPRS